MNIRKEAREVVGSQSLKSVLAQRDFLKTSWLGNQFRWGPFLQLVLNGFDCTG